MRLFDQGRRLKDAGQQLALDNAGAEWRDEILAAFRDWSALRRGTEIVIEDFRAQMPSRLHPRSTKSWGALPRILVGYGLIRPTDRYVPSKSPRTHAHPVRVWRVV